MGFIQDLFRNIFRPTTQINIGDRLIKTSSTGGVVVSSNYFNTLESRFANFNSLPITDFQNLSDYQLNYFLNVLNSSNLQTVFEGDQVVFTAFPTNGTAGAFTVRYLPDYQTPYNSIKYLGELFNLPQSELAYLLSEAQNKAGNKDWLKNTIAWIVKNWPAIVAGFVTFKTVQSSINNTGTPGGFDTPINQQPGQTVPVENVPGANQGFDLGSFISANAVPLIGIGAVGYFALSDNKKKKRRR